MKNVSSKFSKFWTDHARSKSLSRAARTTDTTETERSNSNIRTGNTRGTSTPATSPTLATPPTRTGVGMRLASVLGRRRKGYKSGVKRAADWWGLVEDERPDG